MPAPIDDSVLTQLRLHVEQFKVSKVWQDLVPPKDEVLARFQSVFALEHLPQLTSEEVFAFLKFKNNKHWTGLARQQNILCADMSALKLALSELLDDRSDIDYRLDKSRSFVKGLGAATATAILQIANPDRFGVWNQTSESALRDFALLPKLSNSATLGQKYAVLNELFLGLRDQIPFEDLWTLDAFFWYLKTTLTTNRAWIIALPRPDMEHCIQIGCYGKERAADRLSEVKVGDNIVCYALKESKIIALGTVTRGYYQDESKKFLANGIFGHRFDFDAQNLKPNELDVSTFVDDLTSAPGGNFGLLVKSGFRILTSEDWDLIVGEATVKDQDLIMPQSDDAVAPRWWWVNQGRTYPQERKGGYIWAPQKSKSGQDIFHHANVSKVKAGDIIFHYKDGFIVAVSEALDDGVASDRPEELSSATWGDEGYKVKVNYFDALPTVARDSIPMALRMAMSEEGKSPFTKTGSLNQGYLFSVTAEFARDLIAAFPQLLPKHLAPPASPILDTVERNDYLARFIDAATRMRVNTENGRPRLYKPAILVSIIDALDGGQLRSNEIAFDWLVPLFKRTLSLFGLSGEERQIAVAFFHLQSEPFWTLRLFDEGLPPLRGEPAQLRERVEFAAFDAPYWRVLENPIQRKVLRQAIVKYWFESLSQSSKEDEMFEYRKAVADLITFIERSGFTYEKWQIACYVTALRTKPFLILAGVSGSGKSQLPKLIARATGGNSDFITVRPDWTDSSDVLGFVQLHGGFRPGKLLELASKATKLNEEHFVCIVDEMNLARVEHYFAEVLSHIEDGRSLGGSKNGLLMQRLQAQDSIWNDVNLPSNLALIGTVNMDESSHGFSRKVLDRAFTLEFSEIDLSAWSSPVEVGVTASPWPAYAWQPRATQLAALQDLTDTERDKINEVVNTLIDLNKLLINAQLQLAYRSRDEIALFVLHAEDIIEAFKTRDGEAVKPLDLALQMKVLPRISGGSPSTQRLVRDLLAWSFDDRQINDDEGVQGLINKWIVSNRPQYLMEAKFPRTFARLCLMWERLQHEGYTSYWL